MKLQAAGAGTTEPVEGVQIAGGRVVVAQPGEAGAVLLRETGGETAMRIPPRFFGASEWTVRRAGEGWEMIATLPGSSRCPLEWSASKDGAAREITGEMPMGAFLRPRFVRMEGGAGYTAALGGKLVAAFGKEGAFGPMEPLPVEGVRDGVLVPVREKYLLIAQHAGSGALTGVWLNGARKAMGDPFAVLGGRAVREFDAAANGERIAIFGTTGGGYVTEVRAGEEKPETEVVSWEKPLRSPSIGAEGKGFLAAVVEGTRVLTGRLD